ncbi:MAG: hypothetical protein HFH39_11200 [Lachnospiraceae bacterium]|nr:hypothetical protein [Lachnospiraceae bacterium]
MKKIKFPLVMGNGTEARDIGQLRENFDIGSALEYFSNGKLERWLENNYYDDILEKVQGLDKGGDGFAQQLADALGAEWEDDGKADLQSVMKKAELKERLKPFVSEEELEGMEYIADTQEELERLMKQGRCRIHLFGGWFCIPEWAEGVELIGIQRPKVQIAINSPEEYRKKKIRLQGIEFADEGSKKVAQGDSAAGVFCGLLDVLEQYLEKAQKALG